MKPKTYAWLLPLLGVTGLFILITYLAVHPPLHRAAVRAMIHQHGGSTSASAPSAYWEFIEQNAPKKYRGIDHVRTSHGLLSEKQLNRLRHIPELELLALPFQNASDELLADCISNMRGPRAIDIQGTFASNMVVETLLTHPNCKDLYHLDLSFCPIPKSEIDRLRLAMPETTIHWVPPLSASNRIRAQKMAPGICLNESYQTEARPSAKIRPRECTPEIITQAEQFTSKLKAIEILCVGGNNQLPPRLAKALASNQTELAELIITTSDLDLPSLRQLPPADSLLITAGRINPVHSSQNALPTLSPSVSKLKAHIPPGFWPHLLAGSQLKELTIYSSVDRSDVIAIRKQTMLKRLRLHFAFTEVDDFNLLGNLKNLTNLELGITDVTDEGMRSFTNLTALTTLTMASSKISAAGLKALLGCQNLEHLHIESYKTKNDAIPTLANLPNLKTLNIVYTGIDDANEILALKQLESISVNEHTFSSEEIRRLEAVFPRVEVPMIP